MFDRMVVAGHIDDFRQRLVDNMLRLQTETGASRFSVPTAILLALDEENGGGDIPGELLKRFKFLDLESRDVIDFHLLGWVDDGNGRPKFDLQAFHECLSALRAQGISVFGGYADLLLFDAWFDKNKVELDFSRAMHIDLAQALAKEQIPSIGKFLQTLIDAVGTVRKSRTGSEGGVFQISDKLGLAVASSSLLDYFLDTWGKLIGAPKLVPLSLRKIGPVLNLGQLGK